MRPTRPDPYCGFTDDRERRRALNVKTRWSAVAVMVVALTSSQSHWIEGVIRWLMHWFH